VLFAELSVIDQTAFRRAARLAACCVMTPNFSALEKSARSVQGFFLRLGQIGHGDGRTTSRIMATAISSAAKPSCRAGNRSCFGWRRM
jgi:hypothetical protein